MNEEKTQIDRTNSEVNVDQLVRQICQRCETRGKIWNGSDPKCFKEDWENNWNCATLNEFRELFDYWYDEKPPEGVVYRHYDDQNYMMLFIADIDINDNEDEFPSYLYLSWYKQRGATENVYLLFNGQPCRRPTESEMDIILKYYKKLTNLRRNHMFKHELGVEAEAKVTGLKGIITARSENLYMCNRYYIQCKVGKDGKVPDGWWIDEDDVIVKGPGVTSKPKNTGGPMSQIC